MDKLAIDTAGNALDQSRCHPAVAIEHAHTRAEHAVYSALWNLGGSPESPDPHRDVSIGYDKLAALAGNSKRTIQRLVETLREKLAIEVLQAENSGARQGKTYRVYGPAEILRRRREAGYVWILRDRSAVRLVKRIARFPAAEPAPPPAASALEKIRTIMDNDAAAGKLLERCRGTDSRASDEEILHFLERAMASLRRRSVFGVGNPDWREELIALVPHYFAQPSLIEEYRLHHPR